MKEVESDERRDLMDRVASGCCFVCTVGQTSKGLWLSGQT